MIIFYGWGLEDVVDDDDDDGDGDYDVVVVGGGGGGDGIMQFMHV